MDRPLETLSDFDTIQYVLGSLINRLNCSDCDIEDGEFTPNFTASMTFPGARLRTPTTSLSLTLRRILNPAAVFFQKNLCLNDITLVALSMFRLKAPETGFCTQQHADEFLRLFLKIIIKAICKDKNKSVREARIHAEDKKKRKLNLI